jgi:hypothetical protein
VNALSNITGTNFPKSPIILLKIGKILGFEDFTKTADNMTCMKGIPRLNNIKQKKRHITGLFTLRRQ